MEPPPKYITDVPAGASGVPDPLLARPTTSASVISHRSFLTGSGLSGAGEEGGSGGGTAVAHP